MDTWRGGVPLPSLLEGLGERRSLSERGPGRQKRVLVYLELERTHLIATLNIFDTVAAYI